jgi:hypothetical protein
LVSIVNLIVPTIPYFINTNLTKTNNTNYQIDYSIDITFSIIEFICVGWFTIEIILRFLISYNKLQFFKSAYNIIDLIVLIPFYLYLILAYLDIRLLKEISRMLKILRLFKCTRYSESLSSLGIVMKRSAKEFSVLLFFLSIFVVMFASFIYYLEIDVDKNLYPDHLGFFSIPQSFWYFICFYLYI